MSLGDRSTGTASGGAAETTVQADLRELARVRGWARAFLPDLAADLLSEVVMVLDELVSNALRHARPPFRVSLRRRPGLLRIEIEDGSTATAAPRPPNPQGGRGMSLVESSTLAWGQLLRENGKVVWAELAVTDDPTEHPAPSPGPA